MAFRDAVRGLGMALGFKLAADKFKRDVAREVASELEARRVYGAPRWVVLSGWFLLVILPLAGFCAWVWLTTS